MYNSNEVNNKLRHLTNTIYDSTNNLKSLDYLLLNSHNHSRTQPNFLVENGEKSQSFSKIEQSLENISTKQNRMEDEMRRISYKLKDDSVNYPSFPSFAKPPQKSLSTNYLDMKEPPIEVASSVNRKLQEAQEKLQNDRIMAENRMSAINKPVDISPELKTLIEKTHCQKPTAPIDNQQVTLLTKRITKSESENSTLKFEFESLKRQFANESGSKNALLVKLEQSKSKIHDLEEKIGSLKKELDRMVMENEINKKKAENNIKWQEKLTNLQNENDLLKKEARHCNHHQEIEELRRQKEKVERDRASIKDQMADLTKQIDSKQTHILKLMDELHESQEKLSQKNVNFQDLDTRFHETKNELKYQQKIYHDVVNKIDTLEHSIIELEANKNKGFSIRDDDIERLESQCARLKNELDKTNNHIQDSNQIINDQHKENESLRTQLTNVHSQCDSIRKEMESLIKARSIQDELLKRRENEVESHRCKIQDLQSLLEAADLNGEKFKFDAEIYYHDLSHARETIAVQEERITTLTSTNLSQHEQIVLLQSEVSSLVRKVTSNDSQVHHLHSLLAECRSREGNIDELRRSLMESENCQEKLTADMERNIKKIQLENDAKMKKMEQMLEAERAALKVVLGKYDRQVSEINRLHEEFWNREQLVQNVRKKYAKAQHDLENLMKQKEIEKNVQQSNFNEEIIEHEMEANLANQKLESTVEERDQALRWIIVDINGVIELLSQIDWIGHENNQLNSSSYLIKNCSLDIKSCPPTSLALSTMGGLDVSKCFIEIKSKISWLRSQINIVINHLENYRNANMDLQDELKLSNEKMKRIEEEKQWANGIELDEAKRCIAKLRMREKNETNLQLKCDRLQEELQTVRKFLNGHPVECNYLHCSKSCCH